MGPSPTCALQRPNIEHMGRLSWRSDQNMALYGTVPPLVETWLFHPVLPPILSPQGFGQDATHQWPSKVLRCKSPCCLVKLTWQFPPTCGDLVWISGRAIEPTWGFDDAKLLGPCATVAPHILAFLGLQGLLLRSSGVLPLGKLRLAMNPSLEFYQIARV